MSDPTPPPELLAPAGTLEAGLTAFDAGADAVYAGLGRFNARERGRNLSAEDLSRLVAFARHRGRKVYVTLNTLVKDTELPDVAGLLAELAVMRPHAVLVQDLGVVRLVREQFPCLPVHASTQMGIHNSAGARVAGAMGIQRVILERQVTYAEIAAIRAATDIELEVFVHGALCCSRSGVCLLSSWMGGWSGNRGKCKQACRRRYHGEDGNGFFLSTGDLYSLDAIPRLKAMGIQSLKIEGRLQRPDYVRHVVEAYRMVLDAPDAAVPGLLPAARNVLSQALGRKWVPAFRSPADLAGVIQSKTLAASGLLCGKVVSTERGGFVMEVSRPVQVGDMLRVQPASGDEGPAVAVMQMTVDRRRVTCARKGQRCRIACDEPVVLKARVFRTGAQMPDMAARIEKLPPARPALDLRVCVGAERIAVDIRLPGTDERFEAAIETAPATKHALTGEQVGEAFAKSAESFFAAGEIAADVAPGLFVRTQELRRVRREFWEWVDGTLPLARVAEAWQAVAAAFGKQVGRGVPPSRAPLEHVVLVRDGGKVSGRSIAARPVAECRAADEEAVLPDFWPEGETERVAADVARAVAAGVRRFRITSLAGLAVLPDGVALFVTASFPLPVCNSLAVEALQAQGVRKVTAWPELEQTAVLALAERWGAALEVLCRARLPLLATRFEIPATGRVTDGRGAEFELVKDRHQTLLLPAKVFSIPPPAGVSTFTDRSHIGPGQAETSLFNWERELL